MRTFITLIYIFFFSTLISAQFQNIRVDNPATNDAEEVSIAVNPNNPLQLAGGANISYFFSTSNGGNSWNQKFMSSTLGVWGDPCLIYDGLGNLFYGHLSNPSSSGYWIDRIVIQRSTDNGLTWNNGAGIGYSSPKEQDKEWMAVDMHSQLFKGNLYVTWTEFDNYGSSNTSDSSKIMFSRSTDHGLTFSTPKRINDKSGDCIDSDNTVEGAVPTVGPNGEIYVSWAGPLGLLFDKSTDGGITWGTDKFVSTIPGGWDFDVTGINRANGLPITACDTSLSPYRGNVYILWGDQRNGTSNTDVWFSRSTDGGNTWSSGLKVNTDNTDRHQFFPWMTIDQKTGYIWAVFYDRRNTTGNATDVFVARSKDGGLTFDNFKVSQTSFVPTSGIFFGDYTNIAAWNGKIYPIWMRLDNSSLSVYTALVVDSSTAVPVQLNNFTASVTSQQVFLFWQTITEVNNHGFEIQKSKLQNSSSKNYNWQTVGFISGKGTTTETNRYNFEDSFGEGGFYSYRLKQLDLNGSYNFSEVIILDLNTPPNFKLSQNYPNPYKPDQGRKTATTISYEVPSTSFVTLKVYDVLGNEIATLVNEYKNLGVHEVDFNLSGEFSCKSSGIYLYRLTSGNFSTTKKMIVLR